jgi:outer membrane protein
MKPKTKPEERKVSPLLLTFCVINFLIAIVSVSLHFFKEKDSIVYVDAVKLISEYKGVVPAREALGEANGALNRNLASLNQEFIQLQDSLTVNRKRLSAKDVKLLEETVVSKQRQLAEYEYYVKQQAEKSDKEVSLKILDEVNDYLKRYGEKKGYSIILTATHYGNIAYGRKAVDITDEVLVGLNEEFDRGK